MSCVRFVNIAISPSTIVLFLAWLGGMTLPGLIPGLMAQGASGEAMSMRDCVAYALEHAPAVRRADLEARRSILQVEQQRREALPELNLSSRLRYNFARPVDIAPGGLFDETDADRPIRFGKAIEAGLGLELNYPLYDKSLFTGKDAPRKVEAVSALQRERSRDETAWEVVQTYLQAMLVREKEQLLLANLDRVGSLQDLTRRQVDNGFAKPSALDRLQVARKNLEVQQQNLELQYDQLIEVLKYRMAMPFNETLTLADSLAMEMPTPGPLEMADSVLARRSEIQLLELQGDLKAIQLERIRAEASPDLYLWGGVNLSAWGDTPSEWIDATYWYGASFLGLRLDYPLLDAPSRRTRIELARLDQDLAEVELAFTKRSLKLQHDAALTKLQVNRNELESLRENRALAESLFELTRKEYQEGMTPIMDLLSAETAMREAQSNYLAALLELRRSELEWLYTRGELMDYLVAD